VVSPDWRAAAAARLLGVSRGLPEEWARLTSLVLDRPVTEEDLLEAGERVLALRRKLDGETGWIRARDLLPGGSPEGGERTVGDEAALLAFYSAAGWDQSGVPTEETLLRLRLEWLRD
jgi:aldehyde:ferredoxin oxidoreductase